MYLSFSGWKKYLTCLFAYYLSYVKRLTPPGIDDRLGSIFGSVLGRLFERFYNEELYRKDRPRGALDSLVEDTVTAIIREETTTTSSWRKAGVILWKGTGEGENPDGMYLDRAELEADVRDALARGFSTIKHYRLLGRGARAEVPLDATIQGHKLGGRADFIMRRVRPLNDLIILDGKGSKYRDAYVDDRQLLWYSMLYRFHHGELPAKAGFVFWRFDPPKSISWVDVTPEAVDQVQATVLADIARIEDLTTKAPGRSSVEEARQVFLPIVETSKDAEEHKQACRFCPFAVEEICPGGAKVVQKIREETPRRRRRSV